MPPQTVVTGTQIPLDQAQIDYWLGLLQGNQRGQNFGFGGQLLNFLNNRDRNRAGANAAYGQLGTSIAGLNAAQRGQLASAQQAAIQMLADRSGPQNAVAYQRALAGLSGPGPNQGQATIDPLALLKDFCQLASIEDIYPGGPPQTSNIDVESVIKRIFDQVGQASGGQETTPAPTDPTDPADPTVPPEPPEPPGREAPGGDGTDNVPPLKAAANAGSSAGMAWLVQCRPYTGPATSMSSERCPSGPHRGHRLRSCPHPSGELLCPSPLACHTCSDPSPLACRSLPCPPT